MKCVPIAFGIGVTLTAFALEAQERLVPGDLTLTVATDSRARDRLGAADDDAPQVVVISEKSPFLAGALEVLTLPTIGYAYAGNWSRGIPSALVRIVGFGLVAEQQFTVFGSPPPCEGQSQAGLALAVVGTIWAVIDAAGTARRTNEKCRAEAQRLALIPTFGAGGPGLTVGIRMPR